MCDWVQSAAADRCLCQHMPLQACQLRRLGGHHIICLWIGLRLQASILIHNQASLSTQLAVACSTRHPLQHLQGCLVTWFCRPCSCNSSCAGYMCIWANPHQNSCNAGRYYCLLHGVCPLYSSLLVKAISHFQYGEAPKQGYTKL